MVSVGKLNLATGEVTDVNVKVAFMNSALMALVSVNPKLPPTPIEFSTESRQDPANPHTTGRPSRSSSSAPTASSTS